MQGEAHGDRGRPDETIGRCLPREGDEVVVVGIAAYRLDVRRVRFLVGNHQHRRNKVVRFLDREVAPELPSPEDDVEFIDEPWTDDDPESPSQAGAHNHRRRPCGCEQRRYEDVGIEYRPHKPRVWSGAAGVASLVTGGTDLGDRKRHRVLVGHDVALGASPVREFVENGEAS